MTELERQVVALELPGVLAEPLREAAALAEASAPGRIPFVVVAPRPRLDALGRIAGATSMLDAEDLARWAPIDGVRVPGAAAYLAIDVDLGDDTRGVTPDDAPAMLSAEERSPLTVDEGIALVTHHPDDARRASQRIVFLEAGRVAASGETQAFYGEDSPEVFRRYIGLPKK